ncbi:MAG: LamG domain-containing protein, partial [Sedimentisphaerales bacterium]|nr:LamG domain-containing protein [Sedimentisphaerales bacterium]
MCKKLIYFSFIVLLLSVTSSSIADVDIVAYYGMDEGSGTTVADGSGNGYNGTNNGTPTWVDGPDGFGTALRFVGATGGVECGTFDPAVEGKVSLACWAYFEGPGGDGYQGFICKNGPGQTFMTELNGTSGYLYWNSSGTDAYDLMILPTDRWVHIAIVHDNASGTTEVYANGVLQITSTATWAGNSPDAAVRFGATGAGYNFFNGVIDEVYFFSSLLTAEEVVAVMNGEYGPNASPSGKAKNPQPENNDPDVENGAILSWTSGAFADTHNVFIGTDFNDVNDATIASHDNVTLTEGLDVNNFDPSTLEYGITYYWRVDEVNAPSNPGTFTGTVWSFTVEPYVYNILAENITATAISS